MIAVFDSLSIVCGAFAVKRFCDTANPSGAVYFGLCIWCLALGGFARWWAA